MFVLFDDVIANTFDINNLHKLQSRQAAAMPTLGCRVGYLPMLMAR